MQFDDEEFNIQPNTDGAVDSQHFMTFDLPEDGSDMVDMLVQKLEQFREQLRADYPNTFWLKGKIAFGGSWGAVRRTPSIRIEMRGRRRDS